MKFVVLYRLKEALQYSIYFISLLLVAVHRLQFQNCVSTFVTSQLDISRMKGMSIQSIKQHPSLIPLYACVGAGCCFALFYTIRLATKNPDVSWFRKSNPEPWNEYENKQYKFYSPIRDYSNIKSPAPKF
ncbi:hypothetical protein J437_LFUL012467 [Ladona fulva]|uniref:Cytochrome c oxidase subunit NDUFA4 n=1 Tax=Ladona fulva TaxID=123851 RepID=A0A8K0K1C9_LADFU|nr:hypothetical protein J437_LFUL012467 [Ladona fulva]